MGDRIAVMKDGAIQQIDTPQMLYDHPRNLFVAGFIGSPRMNFSDAVLNEEDGAYGLSLPWGSFPLPDGIPRERLSHYVGRPVVLGIRSEDISPVPDSAPHHIDARIETVESAGAELYLHVSSQDIPLVVRAESTYAGRAGDPVALALNLEKIHLFDKETEAAITHIGH
jgi:multiple sugar transport system ATP-binding protein